MGMTINARRYAVLITVVSTTASAAPAQRATTEIQAIEARATRPGSPPASKPAAPTVDLTTFLAVRHDKLKRITDAQIAKLRRLLAVTRQDDPERADLLFRIAELCAENQRHYFDEAHALDQRIFDTPPGARAPLEAQQRAAEAEQEKWLLEAVKAYVGATRFRRYERMDEVLFRLAALLASVKKDDQAREFLHQLIKDHPTSRYIPDAYLAFAELYFERGDVEGALRFYEKVAQFPRSSVYAYAIYKSGWCHLNLGDHKSALETFVAVARLPPGNRQNDLLAREARKDIVTAYAHVGGPEKAWPFFQRTGGDAAPKMLEALGERYWEQGKTDASTQVYRRIIADNPRSPRICEWQVKVLRNANATSRKPDQIQELERLAAVHDRLPTGTPEQTAACRDALHDAARELALIWHREAQRTRNPSSYAFAERAYRLFLAHFADDKSSYDMSFYLGELYWSLERWRDAAVQYGDVVARDPRGKHLRESAHAAVLAWKAALAVDDDEQRDRVARERAALETRAASGPQPIPPLQQQFIAALRRYRQVVPDAPELPATLYREAYILYDLNRFDEAEPLFREVVERFPTHELAVYAANLFLDCLNQRHETAALVTWVRRFLDTPALVKDAALATELVSLMADSYELEARAEETRGDRKECGRGFLAAADALPTHAKHAERLWNAGQCFQNAHLVGQAIKAWQALIDAHPNDPLARRALFRLGAGYHQLAFYGKAAEYYEAFAKRYAGEAQAPAALGNATIFREGLGETDAALADMKSYVSFYGARRPQDAAGIFFQRGALLEGDPAALRAHLESYLATWGRRGGLDRQVRAHFRLGELRWQASCAHPSPDGACLQITRTSSTRGTQIVILAARKHGRQKRVQCGPPTKSKIVVFDRSRGDAEAAVQHFREAIRLWRAGEAENPDNTIAGHDAEARRAAAAHAAAGAQFHLAEAAYEALLRVTFPQGLDFSEPPATASPRRQLAARKKLEASKRRFAAYLSEKARLLQDAKAQYLDVFKLRQTEWTIAAAARIGQLHQDFAGQLFTAEIPSDLPEVDAWGNRPRDLYCDRLEDEANKVEVKAIEGFRSCLTAATTQTFFSAWSRLCERELSQLAPVEFPLASEVKPEAGFVPLTVSPAPLSPLPAM
jgi:TolA-binding protein